MEANGSVAGHLKSPRGDAALADGDRLRPVALALLTLLLAAACVALAVPFLPALAWAVALAIIAWPLHARLARATKLPGFAAAVTSLAVVLAIVGPVMFVAWRLGREAGTAVDVAQTADPDAIVRQQAGLDRAVGWMDRAGVDLNAEIRRLLAGRLDSLTGLLQGSLAAIVQAAVALYVLYFLLRDRDLFAAGVRGLLPMTRGETERVFTGFADSVHANLYASVVTSAVNAVTGGVLLGALGLPSPTLWAVVIFVLSIVPVAGIFLVWLPAAAYLAMTGRWGGAAALVAWGVLSAAIVDTWLYLRLAGGRMRMHTVPTFIAFLGGLALFGASGIILGPAALAVTAAVLRVWKDRSGGRDHDEPALDAPRREPDALAA